MPTGTEGPRDDSPWPLAIEQVDDHLMRVFEELVTFCDLPTERLQHRNDPAQWTGHEVLEHVHLANGFLLKLVTKIRHKAERRLSLDVPYPESAPEFEGLSHLVLREFSWAHPSHMEPRGELSGSRVKEGLRGDLKSCREQLHALPPGAGTLHRIKMSVVGPEAMLDLYQYLEVIALHGERHIEQLKRCTSGPQR